ncbi:MAG: ABC transporter ATP-binding protein [Burkholderiales bacterium]|nr:ABC transporter ATP-binding protein [Burkholderiales bacterium]
MTQPLLAVDRLSKSYGAIRAVHDVSFAVAPGEIVGVIGPNGSGKTTLFNCILGQTVPSAGAVRFRGTPLTGAAPLAVSRRGIGRTFQSLQVFGSLTVRDNLIAAAQEFQGSMAARLLAPSDAGLGARADAMIERFRLGRVARHPAGSLSYGQQKLVDIAMAFMPDPALVLLDEPAAGINPSLVEELRALLEGLNRERGATFVVIEHNMDFVMRLAQRVLVLAEGRLLAEGAPETVRAHPEVMEAYLGA